MDGLGLGWTLPQGMTRKKLPLKDLNCESKSSTTRISVQGHVDKHPNTVSIQPAKYVLVVQQRSQVVATWASLTHFVSPTSRLRPAQRNN